jgi:hypothetical protein
MATAAQELAPHLQGPLAGALNAVARQINIAQIAAQMGTVGHVTVGQVALGNVTIGTLTLNTTAATLESSQAQLMNVGMNLELQFTLNWSYNIAWFSGSGSDNLGSLWFSVNLGNVNVPSLGNIKLQIPKISLQNLAVQVPPISNLDLGGASFSGLAVTNTTAPSAGFTVGGLNLGSLSLSQLGVPAASSQQATIADFKPSAPVTIPAANLGQIAIPATSISDITSGTFAFDAQTSSRGITANFGIFSIGISVTPIAHMNVGSMQLSNVNLSASVQGATMNNVQIPLELHNVLLNTLKMSNVTIDTVKL